MSAPRLAVLVSGGGRSLENLAARIADGSLAAEIALVLSDRPGIGALARAERLGLPTLVVPWTKELGGEGFGARVFAAVEESGVVLVVLAGFLRLLRVPERWLGRVINIHPALLPAFGGKGMYGDRVHRAVLESGQRTTGCTVHYVDNQYDHGPILLQRTIEVLPDDTAETLAHRVFEEEKIALPAAIALALCRAGGRSGPEH
ncbi:MAG: phosphoribosylglycinamide formyltransferase [Planctomycetota bacterium]